MHRILNLVETTGNRLARGVATKAAEDSSEVFGTLSQKGTKALSVKRVENYYPDDADNYDKEEFDLTPRKNAYYYKYEISKYARQGGVGLRKALELFQTMKSKDRLNPACANFSPLIYGCAKAGYTKKAFDLYEESLKYITKPPNSVVTCLINACAESPFPDYGLKRLEWLRDHLRFNYNYQLNLIQYHSAIKAYGKLGQLEEASKLVQEMLDNKLVPDTNTFNMLLIGCASKKQSGSILALRLYKRLKLYGLKPNVTTYRLMLRCVRDCGIGSPQLLKQAIGELPALTSIDQKFSYNKLNKKISSRDQKNFQWIPLIKEFASSIKSAVIENTTDSDQVELIEDKQKSSNEKNLLLLPHLSSGIVEAAKTNLPNLLSDDHLSLMHQIEAIHIDRLKTSTDRLMLFGGMHGYLVAMERDGCQPDAKTFSLLLGCIKPTKLQCMEYFRLAKDYSVKKDLVFYDLLIRRICEWYYDDTRLSRALYFVEEMHRDGIRPNISTFEALAPGCDSISQALKFIKDVEDSGFTVSDIMFERMLICAARRTDFRYLNELIKVCKERNYRPTKQLVEALELKRIQVNETILKHEKGLLEDCDKPYWLNDFQVTKFNTFGKILGNWLKSVNLKEDEHPWSQFHVPGGSKKHGFSDFVQEFKALEAAKREILSRGGSLGNLAAKVAKRRESAKKSAN